MSDLIEQAAQFAESAKKRLLLSFSHVPDDKLNWAPSETAKSPIHIVAHAGNSNFSFAGMLEGTLPTDEKEVQKLMAAVHEKEASIKTREEAIAIVEAGFEKAIQALKALTPEKIDGTCASPFGPFPTKMVMILIGRHMDNHAAQIDYLQTIWGDTEFRI